MLWIVQLKHSYVRRLKMKLRRANRPASSGLNVTERLICGAKYIRIEVPWRVAAGTSCGKQKELRIRTPANLTDHSTSESVLRYDRTLSDCLGRQIRDGGANKNSESVQVQPTRLGRLGDAALYCEKLLIWRRSKPGVEVVCTNSSGDEECDERNATFHAPND